MYNNLDGISFFSTDIYHQSDTSSVVILSCVINSNVRCRVICTDLCDKYNFNVLITWNIIVISWFTLWILHHLHADMNYTMLLVNYQFFLYYHFLHILKKFISLCPVTPGSDDNFALVPLAFILLHTCIYINQSWQLGK